MDESIAIKVDGLSKKYKLGIQKEESLVKVLSGIYSKKKTDEKSEFWALKNVSFQINKGDVVGIIGKNGAGKSTLLKILSQITKPTEGRIEINGRIASLLEVGTGFHPELSGRENIFLNGTILGMTRKEVKEKFDEIVSFSGVEKFIDTAVKHYSSGMYVRLAFAVAAHLDPEILIIDEVLAVGDAEFQKKCLGKMKEVAHTGRTVLFVSHNLTAISSLCNKGIVLNQGQLTFAGSATEAINSYYGMVNKNFHLKNSKKFENETISVINFEIKPLSGNVISVASGFSFDLEFENKLADATIDTTFELLNLDGVIVFHQGTYIDEQNKSRTGKYRVKGTVDPYTLNAGSYSFNILFGQNSTYMLLYCPDILSFDIENSPDKNGFKTLPGILKPNMEFNTEYI